MLTYIATDAYYRGYYVLFGKGDAAPAAPVFPSPHNPSFFRTCLSYLLYSWTFLGTQEDLRHTLAQCQSRLVDLRGKIALYDRQVAVLNATPQDSSIWPVKYKLWVENQQALVDIEMVRIAHHSNPRRAY